MSTFSSDPLRSLRRVMVAVVVSMWMIPTGAFAYVDVLTSWTLPAPNTNYEFTDSVVVQGTWVLPADWLGNIYVYQDGVQMHDAAHPSADCSLKPAPAGCYISINNMGNPATSTGSFSFDIGPQPDGVHQIQVKFWGGETCAVKAELNSLEPPPSPLYTGACESNEENFQPGQIYPMRSYTVNLPVYPRFTVEPSSNPALNFLNVTTGNQQVKTFTVRNTGQETLSFSVSGVNPPYYCMSGSCSQVVGMNQTKTVSIQFVPDTVGSYPGTLTFTCTGSPLPCDVPSVTRTITGNAVGADLPPKVTIVSGTPLNFGTFYLGNPTYVERTITIKNSGGGLLNGSITLPTGEYQCIGSCSYSLLAGDSTSKIIRFTPLAADLSRSDTAFLSDSGSGATTTFLSSVSDTPIVDACVNGCPGTWNAGTKVNIGDHREIDLYVRNTGGGKLSGVVTGLPDRGFSFTPNANYPYANITPAMGWVKIGKVNFDPADALPADADIIFSNDVPPGGNTDSIHLHGQGNDQPYNGGGTTVLFGDVVINTTKTVGLLVTNSGVNVLNVSIPVGPLSNAAFSCVTNCSFSLGAGQSTTTSFSFTPTTMTSYITTVNVGGLTVSLSGRGIQPAILAYAQDTNGTWSNLVSAPLIDYGTTYYGSPVQNKMLYTQVQSTGGVGTRVNYSIDASAAPHFPCTARCSGTVSVDTPFTWYANAEVTFQPGNAPAGPGDYTETIVLHYDFNDAIDRTLTYQVHGRSISAPYMTVSPTTHSFGNVVVGNTPTKVFTVKNEGVGLLTGAVSVPLSGELVGHWTFDASDMDWGGAKAFDISGKGLTGSLVGSPTGVLGVYGDALQFSGTSYVDLGSVSSAFAFTGDVSASAWVKTSANGKMILQYQNGNPLFYMSVGPTTAGGTANKLVVYLRTNSGSVKVFNSGKSVNDGSWHHVAFVRSAQSGSVRLYVDGLLDSSHSYPDMGAIDTSSGGVHLIGSGAGGAYGFSGSIDDVRVYNRTLSALEVSQIAQGQVLTNTPIFRCVDPSPCVFENLATGDSKQITFEFAPADAFYYTTVPLFSSNGNNVTVSLSGTGLFQPVIKLTPISVVDPDTYSGPYTFLDVGTSNLGAYIEKQVRVWNVGRGPLTGNISFPIGVHFSCQPLGSGCTLNIPEHTYQDVTIRFAPLAVGGLDDTAIFTSNAFNGSQSLQVHGTGIFASIINILGSGQNFPPVIIGKWKEQNITIKNTGTVDFGTGVFSLTGPFTCVASTAGPLDATGHCPYRLDAGGNTVITVRFTPVAPGPVNGTVSLSTLSLANFFVSGTGVPPNVHFIEK